jgi:tripartite ATP-independent transporter DctP family solute receptor
VKKQFVWFLALLLVFVFLVSGCSGNSDQKTTGSQKPLSLKMGSAGQANMPATMAGQKFVDTINQKAAGKVKIDFYPGRQLGDDAQILEQVMSGALELGLVGSSMMSKYTPLFDVLQMPFLLNSYEKQHKAVTSKEMKEIFKAVESKKIKVFAVYEYGMRHFANNNRPINSPEDLKGLKLRVVPSNIILASMKALGANPTPMNYGEVYTGLQTKVIDGEEINLTSIHSEKHDEVLKFVSTVGLWPFPGLLMMNLDAYNKLSPDLQKMFQEVGEEQIKYNIDLMKEAEEKARKSMDAKGVKVNVINDVRPFTDATAPIYNEYMAKDPLIKNFVEMGKALK